MNTRILNTPHRIFLIDGIGAILSILAALAAAQFEDLLGTPSLLFSRLAIIAACFALFSFTCFFTKVKNWRSFLKNLAVFNLLYCVFIASLIFYFFEKMSIWGILFFVGEIGIIVALAIVEWRKAE
jgi:hypothetical protein